MPRAKCMEYLTDSACVRSLRRMPVALLEEFKREPRVEKLTWRKFTTDGKLSGRIEGIAGSASEQEPQEQSFKAEQEEQSSTVAREGNQSLSVFSAGAGSIEICVHTLGGQQLSISGCTESQTLGHVKDILQEMLLARPDEVKLVLNGDIIDVGEDWSSQTVIEAGITTTQAIEGSLIVLRTQSLDGLNESLVKAIDGGQDEVAKDLLDRGAGFDSEGNPIFNNGSTLLHLAVRARLEGLALFLIKSGADVHTANESGRRPLAVAAMKGLGRIVAALLEAGADPYHSDETAYGARTAQFYGQSALARTLAMQNGSLEEMSRLDA